MTTQAFFNFINEQSYDTLKPLWNEYISGTGNGEQIFDSVEDFANTFDLKPSELSRLVFFGDVQNWSDNVYINGYGNLESCWSVENSPICVRELAQWLEDSYHESYQEWKEEQKNKGED